MCVAATLALVLDWFHVEWKLHSCMAKSQAGDGDTEHACSISIYSSSVRMSDLRLRTSE